MRRPYIDPAEATLMHSLALRGAGAGLRASDAERERAAETLRRHHADGRLTTDELEERTERAYAATTRGELDQLFGDLPRSRPTDDGQPRGRRPAWSPPLIVPILVALVLIAIVTSAHVLWFAWPLMFFVLFRFARRGYGWQTHGWPER
jgi:uncharacterized protein DUF1707